MYKLLTIILISALVLFSVVSLVSAPISVGLKETYEKKLNDVLSNITNSFASGTFMHFVRSQEYPPGWLWRGLFKEDLFEKWSVVITNPHTQVQYEHGQSRICNSNSLESFYNVSTEYPDVYVIFFNNYQSLIELCNILRHVSKSWNPEAKFLFITTMSDKNPKPAMDKYVIDIFNELWSRNVFRLSLVIANKLAKTAFLFSSAPYSKFYKTCKNINNFSQLQEINLVNNTKSPVVKIAGYEFEPPNSFFGCSLKGHTFPFPPYSVEDNSSSNGCRVYSSGIEVQLLKLMGDLYNFSVEILSTPSYGTANVWLREFPNGTRRGMLHDIMRNNIDVAFAGAIPSTTFYFCVSLTKTYLDNSLSWYVPVAEMVPMWKLVLNTFSGVTWLFMLSLLVLVTLLYYLMNAFEESKDEEPVDLTIVALTLGFSVRWTKRTRLRIMLLAWSLFCLHVALMFNTRLFSVLTEHPLESDIKTLEDLHDSKFKTCTYSLYKSYYTNKTDGIMRVLIREADICESLGESVQILVKYKNISILTKDDHMAFEIDNLLHSIYQLKDMKFINYPVAMIVAKGSVFLGLLNRLIYNITESGIVLKWLSDVRRSLKHKHLSGGDQDDETGNFLMTREDFVWLYYFFLVGQMIALVTFLLEIYFKQ